MRYSVSMKKLVLLNLLLVWCFTVTAQIRYLDEVFTQVDSTTGIVYGQNMSWDNQPVALALDVYRPSGDSLALRPLMIFVHGGSFIGGVRNDPFMRDLCISFAKRGFVTATVSYRLGIDLSNFTNLNIEFIKATLRSMQDVKAAVRFMRKEVAQNGNPYGIDTSKILLGGYSAGAISAIHVALLKDTTLATQLVRDLIREVGGLNGNSGNAGYSSASAGLFSLAGAVLDTALVTLDLVPSLHIHGTADQVVPYGLGYASNSGFPILEVYGSSLLHARLQHRGAQSELITLAGVGHDIVSNTQTRNTVKAGLVNFAWRFMANSLGVADQKLSGYRLYPNPASELVYLDGLPESTLIRIYDMQGRLKHEAVAHGATSLALTGWPAGMYVLQLQSGQRVGTERLLLR